VGQSAGAAILQGIPTQANGHNHDSFGSQEQGQEARRQQGRKQRPGQAQKEPHEQAASLNQLSSEFF